MAVVGRSWIILSAFMFPVTMHMLPVMPAMLSKSWIFRILPAHHTRAALSTEVEGHSWRALSAFMFPVTTRMLPVKAAMLSKSLISRILPARSHAGSIVNGSGGALLDSPSGYLYPGIMRISQVPAAMLSKSLISRILPARSHVGSIVNGSGGALLDGPYGVFVSGNYAYITSYYSSALEIVDVTDPANPVHAGKHYWTAGVLFPALSLPAGLFVAGNYTYVASHGSDALEIVNVTNPASPVHAGRLDDGSGIAPFLDDPLSLFISGNYAYIASSASNDRLEIVDVTDPANPVHKGQHTRREWRGVSSIIRLACCIRKIRIYC